MYPAKAGSPKTQLAVELSASATSMTLADATVLPPAPNLAVIGDDESAEVVSYTAINGNVVSGLVRALGGTTASVWASGTDVARNYTSFDHDRFIENITDLENTKISGVAWGDIDGTLSTQDDLQDALDAKQNTLTFDDVPTTASNNPVKSNGIYDAFVKEIQYYYQLPVSSATDAQVLRIPTTGSDGKISANTVVLECTFANPEYIQSKISWSSYAEGYISFTGTCRAATTANITLGTKGN
jgi:hypothetical protein